MITREQAMAILAKAMRITGLYEQLELPSSGTALPSFTDVSEVSEWAHDVIALSLHAGIIQGRSDMTLAPKAYITRAEVAVIVERLLKKSELI